MIYFSKSNFISHWDNFGPSQVDINLIASNLSRICRYAGACGKFYSVAEHSVMVSQSCDNPKVGLLHDAGEAYYGDIIAPICDCLTGNAIIAMKALDNVIWTKFDVKMKDIETSNVKIMDLLVRDLEIDHFFKKEPRNIQCLEPKVAETMFLARWEQVK